MNEHRFANRDSGDYIPPINSGLAAAFDSIVTDTRSVILTANQATARLLRRQYLAHRKTTVAPQPPIYSLDSWLRQLTEQIVQQHANSGSPVQIASDDELEALWLQVVRSNLSAVANEYQLDSLEQMAHEAKRIWRQVKLRDLNNRLTDQLTTAKLRLWAQEVYQRMEELDLSDPLDVLLENIDALHERTSSIYLLDLRDQLLPVEAEILDRVAQSVVHLNDAESGKNESAEPPRALEFTDVTSEIHDALAWAREVSDFPEPTRVAIVVPNLEHCRKLVTRLCLETFPADQQPDVYPPPTMNKAPAVRAALNLLQLSFPKHPVEYYCELLRSPFWKPESHSTEESQASLELDARGSPDWRAEFEYQIRSLGERELSTSQFRDIAASIDAGSDASSIASVLVDLEEMRRAQTHGGQQCPPGEWASLFSQQLSRLQWPKYAAHLMEHWEEALDRLSALGRTLPHCDLTSALRHLKRIVAQMRTNSTISNSPVHILGTVESAVGYSHIRVIGAHQYEWPQPPRPSPLLPVKFQAEHDFPRSTPELQLQHSTRLLSRLLNSGSELIFSYASIEDDREQQLTNLLGDLEVIRAEQTSASFPASPPEQLELVDCRRGPELPKEERDATPGGSWLIKNIAVCPFSAFVIHRLGGEEFPEPSLGFSAIDRGNLTHRCLENIWDQLGDLETLIKLSPSESHRLYADAASDSVTSLNRRRLNPLPDQLLKIEVDRLTQILNDWLEMEAQRPEFSVIATEQSAAISLGPLNLKIKVDRIDQLRSGDKLIIDYKTGQSTPTNRWLGTPPEEPQLPLYAISADPPSSAIAFGQINASTQKLVGLAHPQSSASEFLQAVEGWDDLITVWQESLRQLANSYADGDCQITPKAANHRFHRDSLSSIHRWAEQHQFDIESGEESP